MASVTLDVQLLPNTFSSEDVMTSLHPLNESKTQEEASEVVEAYVGI